MNLIVAIIPICSNCQMQVNFLGNEFLGTECKFWRTKENSARFPLNVVQGNLRWLGRIFQGQNLPNKHKFPVCKGETSIIQGFCLQVSYFRGQQNLTFRHISNALLFTAVHVKMKLVDDTLNNERLLFVGTKFLPKKLANCSLYFNAFKINNLKTQKSYKTTVDHGNL